MSKRNQNSTSFPRTVPKPLVQTREQPPIALETRNGIQLLCPFCDDHHAIVPKMESPCGTRIEVKAVQEVVTAKLARKEGLVCIKCHKGEGEMVRYRNSFIHLKDCAPGVRLLNYEPKFNPLAKMVFNLPEALRKPLEKFTGQADKVVEIDQSGENTGQVRGYFFRKGKVNAKQSPA